MFAPLVLAAVLDTLASDLARIEAASPVVRTAHTGVMIAQASSGRILYERDADQSFTPASTQKLVTGSAALALLGSDYRFPTRVSAVGPVRNGTIAGDCFLRGGGDVLLDQAGVDDLAHQLRARGVTRIAGDLVTDATIYDRQSYGIGWSWDDFPYAYSAIVRGLSYHENVVDVTVTPGAAAGLPARVQVDPPDPSIVVESSVTTTATGSAPTLDLARDPERFAVVRVTGTIAAGGAAIVENAAVPDPERFAGDAFRDALLRAGIALTGSVRSGVTAPNASQLAVVQSLPLAQLLPRFWLPSDNLIGETLLKAIGLGANGAPGTSDHGIAATESYLQSLGIDTASLSLVDGSGLSRQNNLTPRALARLLITDYASPDRDLIFGALPLAGVRGTLVNAYRGTPLERRLLAKTGSMSLVSGLAGYLISPTRGPLVVVSLIDDATISDDAVRAYRTALFSRALAP